MCELYFQGRVFTTVCEYDDDDDAIGVAIAVYCTIANVQKHTLSFHFILNCVKKSLEWMCGDGRMVDCDVAATMSTNLLSGKAHRQKTFLIYFRKSEFAATKST